MPFADVAFDPVLASSGRLRILTALAGSTNLEFVQLRLQTRLTDGNLCTHTRRLESAGFVAVHKSIRDRKPVTHVRLTEQGREALERHARELLAALQPWSGDEKANAGPVLEPAQSVNPAEEDEWID